MNKKILFWAAILGALSIGLGAFGAHGLKKLVEPEQIAVFETGVKYQMYHALFLFFLGFQSVISEKLTRLIFYFTIIGVLFFSGSLYLLATNAVTSFDFKIVGPITPIGGLFLILSWLLVSYGIYKKPIKKLDNI